MFLREKVARGPLRNGYVYVSTEVGAFVTGCPAPRLFEDSLTVQIPRQYAVLVSAKCECLVPFYQFQTVIFIIFFV